MRLIGAGLPRTGTLSQKVALEMLGLAPCYHMVNVLGDLEQAETWRRALGGEQPWAQVFDGFQATVDWPGSFFYKELVEAYPDAKVLLSIRDADAWERSMRETIWGIFYGDALIRDLSCARCRVDPEWRGYIELMEEMWRRSGLIDNGADTDPESMKRAMTGCWCGRSATGGSRCAGSSSCRFRTRPSRTSMTARYSRSGSSTARCSRCRHGGGRTTR
jgi:hypothetical protein